LLISLCFAAAVAVATPIAVPAEVHENMLLLDVRVNGGKPLTFLLDTAAPRTLLDPRVAAMAKVADGGAASLDIGGLVFRAEKTSLLDLAFFEPLEGRALHGILGMDLFRAFAVEMDFDAGMVRFHDAPTFRYEGDGEVVPVTITKDRPFLTAKLKLRGKEEVERSYLIDSGSAGALSDPLFKPQGEPIGPDLDRAEYVAIGSFRFAGANGTTGDLKIGGELLKRFNIIADFARSRMILAPNRHFGDALLFDTSGIDFEQTATRFKIGQVYPRTPGAEAGLKVGDVILKIDGQPALTLGLIRVRLMFHQVRTHMLTIARDGKTLAVPLRLRRLL
jgi:hypothetical protein